LKGNVCANCSKKSQALFQEFISSTHGQIDTRDEFIDLQLTHYRPALPFGNKKKNILQDLFSSVLSQFEKYHPSAKLKFNYLGSFQS